MLEPVCLLSEEPAPASATLHKRLGMNQACAAHRLAYDLSRATQPTRAAVHTDPSFSPAVMMVEDMRPKNSAEALIASQLVALTPLMLEAVGHANMADTAQGKVLWAGEAVKLARTSGQLADTLARLQRGGEQRVIIERVDVRDGGQAVVGVVHRADPGGMPPISGSTP